MSSALEKQTIFNNISKFHQLNDYEKNALENYVTCLLDENTQYSFIGKSTVPNIWHRHIYDCAQLISHIDKNSKCADLGSGAGLPGIVVSILGIKEIHLIEKSFRKADFLRKVKNLSKNRIIIHQLEIDELKNVNFDCIMSRALAPLDRLLTYCHKFLNSSGYCLFLKGKNLPLEIKTAEEKFLFSYQLFPSLTSDESNIIKITNIQLK